MLRGLGIVGEVVGSQHSAIIAPVVLSDSENSSSCVTLNIDYLGFAGLEDVKPGATVDLPVWLLMELAKRDMIAVK